MVPQPDIPGQTAPERLTRPDRISSGLRGPPAPETITHGRDMNGASIPGPGGGPAAGPRAVPVDTGTRIGGRSPDQAKSRYST